MKMDSLTEKIPLICMKLSEFLDLAGYSLPIFQCNKINTDL